MPKMSKNVAKEIDKHVIEAIKVMRKNKLSARYGQINIEGQVYDFKLEAIQQE